MLRCTLSRIMRLIAAQACLLSLLCVQVIVGQHSERGAEVGRLVSLGKLWATIKYFHPSLSESRPEEWDAALLDVIPEVQAAKSRQQYAAAVRRMVGRLDDPVTRVVDGVPESAGLPFGFASVEVPWWLAGGWALDVHLGRTHAHDCRRKPAARRRSDAGAAARTARSSDPV